MRTIICLRSQPWLSFTPVSHRIYSTISESRRKKLELLSWGLCHGAPHHCYYERNLPRFSRVYLRTISTTSTISDRVLLDPGYWPIPKFHDINGVISVWCKWPSLYRRVKWLITDKTNFSVNLWRVYLRWEKTCRIQSNSNIAVSANAFRNKTTKTTRHNDEHDSLCGAKKEFRNTSCATVFSTPTPNVT